jgi:uncharacterized protein with HEPN domain
VSRNADYLEHILGAIAKIEAYAGVGEEQFFTEPLRQDAIIRQLEIIGEATKRLSRNLRSRHSEVAWRRMSGMRDVLIHNYMGIDLTLVWSVTQNDILELKRLVTAILDVESR